MVKVMYNDKLVYNLVIWVFWGYFIKREGSFKWLSSFWINQFDCVMTWYIVIDSTNDAQGMSWFSEVMLDWLISLQIVPASISEDMWQKYKIV